MSHTVPSLSPAISPTPAEAHIATHVPTFHLLPSYPKIRPPPKQNPPSSLEPLRVPTDPVSHPWPLPVSYPDPPNPTRLCSISSITQSAPRGPRPPAQPSSSLTRKAFPGVSLCPVLPPQPLPPASFPPARATLPKWPKSRPDQVTLAPKPGKTPRSPHSNSSTDSPGPKTPPRPGTGPSPRGANAGIPGGARTPHPGPRTD